MPLTNDGIDWYDSALSNVDIIDSCGELSNVPLIGTQREGVSTQSVLGTPREPFLVCICVLV